jgi:hypothetical protein
VGVLNELFDTYGRNARLFPALLIPIPLLAVPNVMKALESVSSGIVSGIVGIALLYGLTHAVRALGKRAEARLLKKWGGFPTPKYLMWSDTTLDSTTKRRYYKFFRANGIQMPSESEERAAPESSREKLGSAVTWLRNNRRDEKHKILHSENAAYGFRRNLYGAKPLGLLIAAVAGATVVSPLFTGLSDFSALGVMAAVNAAESKAQIGIAISLASMLLWLFIVTPSWVRAAGDQYARALLETCDSSAA